MEKPKLQLALDIQDMAAALAAAQKAAAGIDVIEAGTILMLSQGMKSVSILKKLYPNHVILSDIRIIKAGGKLAAMAYEGGADWVTVICDASRDTVEAVVSESRKRPGTDVQIEINEGYDDDRLKYFLSLGITQLIYHRSAEVVEKEEKWDQRTLSELKRLSDMGFLLSITGGLELSEIQLFKEIPVYCFIAGRKICNARNPLETAMEYQKEIRRVYHITE